MTRERLHVVDSGLPNGVQGAADPQFACAIRMFSRLFPGRRFGGGALAVYLDGRPVVDVWTGWADRRGEVRWSADTGAMVFSATKGVAATVLHRLADRGRAARRAALGTADAMTMSDTTYDPTIKQKAEAKTSRIPIKIVPAEVLKKPEWIRVKAGSPSTRFYEIKQILREHKLHTVCEEASCPNIGECFGKGTATFMIMGDKCTRRCPFCDVGHGRPDPLDVNEPLNLAKTIAALKLKYVVITSVDRDDLKDGGAGHFAECITKVRELSPTTQIEVLVPDFRGRADRALNILKAAPPDVMNHNLETAPRLYKEARPGSDYAFSLNLLKRFMEEVPGVPTKSGIMVGLGETDDEIRQVMRDMRAHDIDMITIGQYLAPSGHHLPVRRYVTPDQFKQFEKEAYELGFTHAAVGAMVRSSYHADQQAHAALNAAPAA